MVLAALAEHLHSFESVIIDQYKNDTHPGYILSV
jgi:hypothetical protein